MLISESNTIKKINYGTKQTNKQNRLIDTENRLTADIGEGEGLSEKGKQIKQKKTKTKTKTISQTTV